MSLLEDLENLSSKILDLEAENDRLEWERDKWENGAASVRAENRLLRQCVDEAKEMIANLEKFAAVVGPYADFWASQWDRVPKWSLEIILAYDKLLGRKRDINTGQLLPQDSLPDEI